MENGFVYIDETVHGIRWDAKYATWDNFTGGPVEGYCVNRVVGTLELAQALLKVQKRAELLGYGLLLWDGYRPQRAVDYFLDWVNRDENGYTKEKHYPHIEKNNMVKEGYIAQKSGHSRGSTVDLTLYDLKSRQLFDMGGDFDLMDEISHVNAEGISFEQYRNRIMLRDLMEYGGFLPYEQEWWHYSLANEPYPDTYYDFVIA